MNVDTRGADTADDTPHADTSDAAHADALGAASLRTTSVRSASLRAFGALLARDLYVLRRSLRQVVPRTIIQPLLLVFVFTYVFPKIGQSVGGDGQSAAQFSTLLVAGVTGLTVLFQGIQTVALPLVQEFGVTREIEDRVLAPLPVPMVAMAKIVAGALQGLLAALVVFPISAVVPATPVDLSLNWPVIVTLLPLASLAAAALGLAFGTYVEPRQVPVLFGIVIIPITFLGAIYYPWTALTPVPWLKVAVLVNPLVYISEGMRAALTEADHMPLWAIYGALAVATVALTWIGVRGFQRRVLS